MSVKKDLDELIDWYEKNRQEAQCIQVCATANTVRRFAKRERGANGRAKPHGQYVYRGRVIVPIRKPRKERAQASTQTEAVYESR